VSTPRIEEIIVRGRADSRVGVAKTASEGTIGFEQLATRTLARPGEILETVPGLITTQHSGGGKANQFFLRGFNLDHGTDFATSIDGMPVNLPTHGHGQGWTDLNFLIPQGFEIANYWSPSEHVTIDADFSMSRSRFRDSDPSGREIPSSVETVIASGIHVDDVGPMSGGLRLRYFGPRPLSEDGSAESDSTLLVSARIGYRIDERWTLGVEGFNLLNRDDSEIDYFYASRLAGEDAGPDEGGGTTTTSIPPIRDPVRVSITARF
jgi:hypothetical protein